MERPKLEEMLARAEAVLTDRLAPASPIAEVARDAVRYAMELERHVAEMHSASGSCDPFGIHAPDARTCPTCTAVRAREATQ